MKRLALAVVLLPLPVLAEEQLETIIVTATRIPTPASLSTHTGSYFDANFMRDNTRRNLPDALALLPGVLAQKTTYGHGSPFIRGQTGRANLLLVDGVRLNNSLWRGGPVQYWNTVDSFAIERVELIKSQGSVPFGSDAIGGTLNAFTRSSGFAQEPVGAFFTHGAVDLQYLSTGAGSNITRIEGALGRGGSWGLNGGVSIKNFGDIEDSAVGRMKNTGYDENAWDLRFDTALGANATLTLAYQDVDQDDIWRWHRTLYNPGWRKNGHVAAPGTWVANIYDQERSLGYARLNVANDEQGAWFSDLTLILSYQEWSDSELQDRRTNVSQAWTSSRYRQLQFADVSTFGADLVLTSELGPGTLAYGIDYYNDDVDSSAFRDTGAGLEFRPASRPVADDSGYELLGIHALYRWRPSKALQIEGGARYTHAAADIGKRWDSNLREDVSSSDSWNNVVLSLRGILELAGGWSIYGGASQAFRAPNLNDLSGALTSRSGIETAGSPELDPEKYLTYELGTRLVGETLWFGAAVFYTDIDDIITSAPVAAGSNNTLSVNGSDGYIWGLEAEAGWEITEHWRLSGFVGWQEGRTNTVEYVGGPSSSEPFSRALPLSGTLALRWTHSSQRLWVEGRMQASETADRLSASDIADVQRIPTGGTPGYTVAMLHTGWQLNDHIALTLGLENLFDEDYRIHGSGNNEPGLNAIASVRASW
jgi:hemoglobin/transferrin/lactoferrin receptor protein